MAAKNIELQTQAADITTLIARCEDTSPATLPLDKSFESLDRVEDFLREHPEEQARIARYVGETLIHHAGGRWEAPKPNSEDGDEPVVTKLAIIPKARFRPAGVTAKALRWSRSVIRDDVERYDIEHRRAALAGQLARLPEELEALRADIGQLTGYTPDALDDRSDVLTAVEEALVALITKPAPRDEFRRTRARAVLWLGDLVQRRIGGEWTVCEDHKGELGEFEVDGWAPSRPVNNVAPQNRGIFARTLPLLYQRGKAT
jgi:hypothetical protein